MPHYHEGNRPYKVTLTSELSRTIFPQFSKQGSVVIARDGVVYERMKDGSFRRVDRGVKKKRK